MKFYNKSILAFFSLATVGCATSTPNQLVEAREAYHEAEEGPAATVALAELKTAEQALALAEKVYRDDGAGMKTNDYAYIAMRRSEIATAVADRRNAETMKVGLEAQRVAVSDQIRDEAVKGQQATAKKLDAEQDKSAAERAGRVAAEMQTAVAKADAAASKQKIVDMQAALARWAKLAENERGLVITLSSGVLFATNKSEVLPAAGAKLSEVALLLRTSPDRHVTVEGHCDSAGNDATNMVLSQARADAVRSYLVSQGVPAESVSAVGLGESKPIATNATVEGRANNRRVEIVLAPLTPTATR